MFALLHSDINSLKSGLLRLTGQPYCKESRSAKVKDGVINLILRNNLIDRYTILHFETALYSTVHAVNVLTLFFLKMYQFHILHLSAFLGGMVSTKTAKIGKKF